ncbi:MarR family winged helix-turn-helix transcriptional regulator [Janibacter melonis]|uniref:MarR family winged helix-turn-helix transcriptional regulator n=1 Tax=Janibacter melonis TaxID=262209 RepID=UPI0020440287|nr:MarR family winged helix-turn-helix transcriptional regulator [Janibacter melonis]MCM3555609.1 MarR family winged helix-turn-helix transcriptional regulator [Janibacter melonis]
MGRGGPSTSSPARSLRTLVQVAAGVPGAMARRAGFSHNEMAVLDLISDAPHGPAEIARALSVSSAAASGIVDRLVARGYAVRTPHPEDGRRTLVEISDAGRAEMLGHLLPMLGPLQALDDAMTDADRAAVQRYLDGATQAIRRLL